jgi:tartrate dehydrogenase/decarboxylase/D-malate dehydrogenase
VRLLEGVKCPLAGRSPGDIDYLVVRENTGGEYTNLGGVMFAAPTAKFVIQESVFTDVGCGSRPQVRIRAGAVARRAST